MFCPKCGAQTDENGVCAKCSNSSKLVRVVFNRRKSIFGCAVSYKVFVDGVEVAKLKNGASQEVMLPVGNHSVAFDMWSASNTQELVIPDCNTVYVDTGIKMGLLTNKIGILSSRCE